MIINRFGGGGGVKQTASAMIHTIAPVHGSSSTLIAAVVKGEPYLFGATGSGTTAYWWIVDDTLGWSNNTGFTAPFGTYTNHGCACEAGGKLYVISATNSSYAVSFYSFDGTTWTSLAAPPAAIASDYVNGSCFTDGTKVFYLSQSTTTMCVYSISGNTWTTATMPYKAVYHNNVPIVSNGTAYMVLNTASSGTSARLYTMNTSTNAFTDVGNLPIYSSNQNAGAFYIRDGVLYFDTYNGTPRTGSGNTSDPGVFTLNDTSWTRIANYSLSDHIRFNGTPGNVFYTDNYEKVYSFSVDVVSNNRYYWDVYEVWPK